MPEAKSPPPLNPSTCGALVMLAAVFVLGLAAQALTWQQDAVAMAGAAFVLLIVWLWQRTLQQAQTAPPLTARQRAWNGVVFVVWLAFVAGLVWWGMRDRQQQAPQQAAPMVVPEDDQAGQLQRPDRPR